MYLANAALTASATSSLETGAEEGCGAAESVDVCRLPRESTARCSVLSGTRLWHQAVQACAIPSGVC
jgi:hypothetical protein